MNQQVFVSPNILVCLAPERICCLLLACWFGFWDLRFSTFCFFVLLLQGAIRLSRVPLYHPYARVLLLLLLLLSSTARIRRFGLILILLEISVLCLVQQAYFGVFEHSKRLCCDFYSSPDIVSGTSCGLFSSYGSVSLVVPKLLGYPLRPSAGSRIYVFIPSALGWCFRLSLRFSFVTVRKASRLFPRQLGLPSGHRGLCILGGCLFYINLSTRLL